MAGVASVKSRCGQWLVASGLSQMLLLGQVRSLGKTSWGTSAGGALHLEGEAAQRQVGGDEGRGAGAGPREESPTDNLLGAGGTRP